MTEVTIVVPCYNEAQRLPVGAFKEFIADNPNVHFVFVEDGSSDRTEAVVRELIEWRPQASSLIVLPRNMGKAEAVRRGFLESFNIESEFTGFWDADLATPLSVIPQFCQVLRDNPDLVMVLGSRVRLLGWNIERRAIRPGIRHAVRSQAVPTQRRRRAADAGAILCSLGVRCRDHRPADPRAQRRCA
jgi:glycosyltransferase involved in cell wall biosynthesis